MQAFKISVHFIIAGISISLGNVHLALSCLLIGLLCIRAVIGIKKDVKKPNTNQDEKN